MAFKLLKLSQLAKLENNPRTISEDDFQTLCTSIQENKDYFNARPLILSDRTGELVIIAGNQRYEAAKHLKLATVPTYLIKGLTKEKEDEIIIRDNVSNGRWDMDMLANEWDKSKLEEWGVPVYFPEDVDLDEFFEESATETEPNKNKIVLEYSEEDFELVNAAFNKLDGSKEDIVFKFLGL